MNTKHLNGSKWTSLNIENKRRHFLCLQYNNKDKTVLMQAVIDKLQMTFEVSKLKDKTLWQEGWGK